MYYNNNCHNCVNKRDIPGDAHISCANPSMFIKGDEHAIESGWFLYPFNFDPVWHTRRCPRFVDVKYKECELIEDINESLIKCDELSLGVLNIDWNEKEIPESVYNNVYDYISSVVDIIKEKKSSNNIKSIEILDKIIEFLKEKFEKTKLERIKELLKTL